MRSHHRWARRLLATACAGTLLLSCSSDPDDQLDASVEPSPSAEPTEEPSESPEPEASEVEAPPLGEDEPLFAPLPELTPDPDNDVPDDLEQVILDAYADAYETEFGMYGSGELDEESLAGTHAFSAYDDVIAALEAMADASVVERSPDTVVDKVFIRDFAGGAAVVRECFTIGAQTGDYDRETGELVQKAEEGSFARDWLLELVELPDEEDAAYRVVEAARSGSEGC